MLRRLTQSSSSRRRREEGKQMIRERDQEIKRLENEMLEYGKRMESERNARRTETEIVNKRMMLEDVSREEKERRKGEVMDRTEISNAKLDLTVEPADLVERLERHPAGKMLKNVVISNKPPEDRELNLVRLRTYKPLNERAKLTLMDIEPINLVGDYVELPFTDALSEKQFSSLKEYCLVSDVFVHYIPMDTFFSESSPVNFSLNDFRKVQDTQMRYYSLTHSAGYNLLFSLDYCVRTCDLKHLNLTVSTSLSTFKKEIAWAAMKVIITISHMDFPVKSNMQETMGVLHMSDSDLKEYLADPRGSDGVITPEALRLMKNFYLRGDIENVNLPKNDKKEVNYAATNMNVEIEASDGFGQEENVRDLLSNLREKGLERQRKREKESREEKSNHGQPSKSSLKKSKENESENKGSYDKLSEISVGEGNSDQESDRTVNLPMRPATPPRGVRSVNF